jgi:hypothetical protein
MSFRYSRFPLPVFLCAALLFGCAENDETETIVSSLIVEDYPTGESPVVESEGTRMIALEDHLFLTVDTARFLSYQWKVVVVDDFVDVEIDLGACIPRDGGSGYDNTKVECIFEQVGKTRIELKVEELGGKFTQYNYEVDVVGKVTIGDQAPILTLDLKANADTEDIISTISTDSGLESQTLRAETEQAVPLVFDFSRTQDDKDELDALSLEMRIGDGEWETVGAAGTMEKTFEAVGDVLIHLRATDSVDNVAEKTFFLAVTCQKANYVPMTINPDAVRIEADPVLNFFNYSLDAGVVSGGQGSHRFMWDFNGDNVLDTDWVTEDALRIYTVYAGERAVSLVVEDECNAQAVLELQSVGRQDFEIPLADGVAGTPQGPQIPGYHFIQGVAVDFEDYGQQYQREEVIVTQEIGSTEEPRKVRCEYSKRRAQNGETWSDEASLRITGINQYEKGEIEEPGHDHGYILNIREIPDPTGLTAETTIARTFDVDTADVHSLHYFTDGEGDGVNRYQFSKQEEACDVNLMITVAPATGTPCGDAGDSGETYMAIIDGTFSCPHLKAAGSDLHLSIEQGSFYCEVAEVDACVGGGGGGGGIPPRPE